MPPQPTPPSQPLPADWRGDELPRDGRLLGIDYGTRRLGFAVSTPEQSISCPLETCTRHGVASDARRLRELIEDYRLVGFVVGLPLHMNGDEGESARQAREFGRWLRETLGRPVTFWDERCSSAAADDWMLEADLSRQHRKGLRDRLAAHVILHGYLAATHPPPPRPIDEPEDQ
jgi:putative Holliday junction resolvase